MGLILERVLELLNQGGFQTALAYPGRMFPRIRDFAAAVHIQKVDQAAGTVTVSVTVLSPAQTGGTACEEQALGVMELLREDGAVCVQGGCRFLGVEQVFAVEVLAVYTGAEAPGFSVYIDGMAITGVRGVTAQEVKDPVEVCAIGQSTPWGMAPGSRCWKLRLEEQIPVNQWEPESAADGFSLIIATARGEERYQGCCWTSLRQEFTAGGVSRIREAVALSREEAVYG